MALLGKLALGETEDAGPDRGSKPAVLSQRPEPAAPST